MCGWKMRDLKLLVMSDTHLQHWSINTEECDIAIHCGDATNLGTEVEVYNFMEWFAAIPATHHLYVPGNHDRLMERVTLREEVEKQFPNVEILVDRAITIEGYRFYGTPWVPYCGNWAFMLKESYQPNPFKMINRDTEILLTHGPAYEILDDVGHGYSVGSEYLLEAIQHLYCLQYHFFGHIHESHGHKEVNGVHHYNVACCIDGLQPALRITLPRK